MSGIRPIEIIVHAALSEQAPTVILNNYFCMADLLQKFYNFYRKFGQNSVNWKVTIQYRSKHLLPRPQENDSIMQNPIGEADLEWILHHNCEGTEQLHWKIDVVYDKS